MPASPSAAVLSLALGIGANTAIFSVLHDVVLNPLPYDDPERLMIVWETSADNAERWVAPANFVDWRRDARSFASLAAFDEFAPTLSGYGEAASASARSAPRARSSRRSAPAPASAARCCRRTTSRTRRGVAVLSRRFVDARLRRVARCASAERSCSTAASTRSSASCRRRSTSPLQRGIDDLAERRSRRAAHVPVRRRPHRRPRLAHHLRHRPARAGRHARRRRSRN